jgi:hypothetical protein
VIDVSILLGRCLEQIARHDHSWGFTFSDGLNLQVHCLWRLLVAGRIATTSEDHGHKFGLPTPVDCVEELRRLIGGTAVIAASVRAGTVDVSLDFGSGTLELIATSAGYEAWLLSGPDFLLVGQPGYE